MRMTDKEVRGLADETREDSICDVYDGSFVLVDLCNAFKQSNYKIRLVHSAECDYKTKIDHEDCTLHMDEFYRIYEPRMGRIIIARALFEIILHKENKTDSYCKWSSRAGYIFALELLMPYDEFYDYCESMWEIIRQSKVFTSTSLAREEVVTGAEDCFGVPWRDARKRFDSVRGPRQ